MKMKMKNYHLKCFLSNEENAPGCDADVTHRKVLQESLVLQEQEIMQGYQLPNIDTVGRQHTASTINTVMLMLFVIPNTIGKYSTATKFGFYCINVFMCIYLHDPDLGPVFLTVQLHMVQVRLHGTCLTIRKIHYIVAYIHS